MLDNGGNGERPLSIVYREKRLLESRKGLFRGMELRGVERPRWRHPRDRNSIRDSKSPVWALKQEVGSKVTCQENHLGEKELLDSSMQLILNSPPLASGL